MPNSQKPGRAVANTPWRVREGRFQRARTRAARIRTRGSCVLATRSVRARTGSRESDRGERAAIVGGPGVLSSNRAPVAGLADVPLDGALD